MNRNTAHFAYLVSIALVGSSALALVALLLPVLLASNSGVLGIYALALIVFAAALLIYMLLRAMRGAGQPDKGV